MATHTDANGATESEEGGTAGRGVEEAGELGEAEEYANPWYEIPVGQAIVVGGVILTLLAVTASIAGLDVIAEDVGVPFDVYLYGFFGAMARSLLAFVTDVDPDTDDVAYVHRSWIQVVRLGLRLVGALCLAAGIYLAHGAVDDALVFTLASPDEIFAGVAFLAGFYVERVYRLLGTVAKRLLRLTDGSDGESTATTDDEPSVSFEILPAGRRPDEPRWYRDPRSLGLFGLGLALLAIGVVASLGENVLPLVPPVAEPVPSYVYLYALLGSLGYLFTTLFREFDRSLLSLLQKGIRVPAALLLAAGLYMFSFLFVDSATTATGLLSGLAFLVGLYVNVALVTLDTIASRVLSKFSDEST